MLSQRRATEHLSYMGCNLLARFRSSLSPSICLFSDPLARKAITMCSFHQPGCSVVIDALPTPCVNAYDMFMQDQELGGLGPESEVFSLALRGFLDNECPLVRYITSAFSLSISQHFSRCWRPDSLLITNREASHRSLRASSTQAVYAIS